MSEIMQTAVLNWLKATADDAMGMEPGDRHMANEAHKLLSLQIAENSKLREELEGAIYRERYLREKLGGDYVRDMPDDIWVDVYPDVKDAENIGLRDIIDSLLEGLQNRLNLAMAELEEAGHNNAYYAGRAANLIEQTSGKPDDSPTD